MLQIWLHKKIEVDCFVPEILNYLLLKIEQSPFFMLLYFLPVSLQFKT